MGLLMTLKGLPLAYNRDLQEDKNPYLMCDTVIPVSDSWRGLQNLELKHDNVHGFAGEDF
jgi:argininosuccinate lyase